MTPDPGAGADARLAAAYRAARYRVDAPGGELVLRVGRRSRRLDALLAALGARRFAWLTAVNPGSRRLSERDNARRLAHLDAEIARRGWRALPGASRDPQGHWPDEPSRLLLDVDAETARALARQLGQNALLVGSCGEPVRLLWVAAPPRAG